MKRVLNLPSCVLEANATEDVVKEGTVFLGYSDCQGKYPLTFQKFELTRDQRYWCDFQYDRETENGTVPPRDMIYGFVALPMTPFWKSKQDVQTRFQLYTGKQWGEAMQLPPLEKLQRLKANTYIQNGSWIIFVRLPRPIGSRNVVPYNRRKDVLKLRIQHEIYKNDQANEKLHEIRAKIASDAPHPTEAQLYLTKSKALIQAVTPNIVCIKCGAKGHHMVHVHDDVYEEENDCLEVQYPSWMGLKEMPQEKLDIVTVDDSSKGHTIEIRNVQAQIPLRLARSLKLRGVNIEGKIEKCGVDIEMEKL
jgi:hypothetical protein